MEFLPSEIARLVLGYLDDEKCDQAYNAFLKASEHLTECVKMKKMGRNFSTKVLRLNLCDILDEYAAVYSLVEERLSKVEPETCNRLTMQGTLLDKLTYLLNGTGSGQTVLFSITVPPGKSPQTSAVAHVRKKLRSCSTSERRKAPRLDTSSKSSSLNDLDDNMSLNVETTALSSLPGNIKQRAVTFNDNIEETFDEIHKTPRRRAQTLPSRRTHSNPDDDEESNIDSADLDEILEHGTDDVGNASYGNQTASTSTLPMVDEEAKHSHGRSRLRSTRLKSVDASMRLCEEISSEIDHENSVAIQNIISINSEDRVSTPAVKENFPLRKSLSASSIHSITAAQMFNEFNPVEPSYPPPVSPVSAASINEVTATLTTPAVFPESARLPIPISASINSNNQPVEINSVPVVSSTNVVVVGQPNLKSQSLIMADPFQPMMADSRIYLINSNKGSGLLQPAFLSQPAIISDGDMIKMPMIMRDEPSTSYAMPKKPPAPRKISKIMPKNLQPDPKDTIKISTSIQESESMNYYVNIQAEPKSLSVSSTTTIVSDSGTTTAVITAVPTSVTTAVPTSVTIAVPTSVTTAVPTSVTTAVPTSVTTVVPTSVTTAVPTAVTTTVSTSVATSVSTVRSVPLISLSSEKKNPVEEKCLTPLQSTSALEGRSTSSSKSHIRALDFSTPPKKQGSASKSSSAHRSTSEHKSSSPTREKVTKESVRSLFVSPVKKSKIPIATKSPGPKLQGDWSGNDLIFQDDKDDGKNISSDSLNESLDSKGRTKRAAVLKSPYGERGVIPVKYKAILDNPADKLLKEKNRWDKELRSLVPKEPEPVKKSPAKKPAKRSRAKSTNTAINTTADVASSIEAVLAKMEEDDNVEVVPSQDSNVEVVPNEASKKQMKPEEEKKNLRSASKPAKEKKVVEKKKPVATKKNAKEKKVSEKKIIKDEQCKETEVDKNEKLNQRKPSKRKAKQNAQANIKKEAIEGMKDIEEEKHSGKTEIRNMNPRVRKKCNVRSVLKPPASYKPIPEEEEEIPVISLPESSITTEQLRKDLEESKLASETLSNIILAAPVITMEDLADSYPSKITPDMSNKLPYSGPMLAKRNITPVLETPIKCDSLSCPLTPNFLSTYIDSPLSAMLNDNNALPLEFSAIMTPSFPMTPSIIPITPNIPSAGSIGSYVSRPTDYSNSSSYYHPSDGEQGQKLEHVLIQEAIKMEGFQPKARRTSTPAKVITESVQAGNSEINITENEIEPERKGVTACSVLLEPIDDSILLNKDKSTAASDSSESSDSSCSMSSCSSDCSTESDEAIEESGPVNNNKTVIHVPILKSPTTHEKSKQTAKNTKSPERKIKSKVTKEHEAILNALKEKRRRTIMMLSTENAKKTPQKKPRVLRNPKKNTSAAAKVARGRLRILDESLPNNSDDQDLVQFVKKPLRKSKSPSKASIEFVASKLLETKKSDLKHAQKVQGQSNSDTSLESEKCLSQDVEEEEIPRLHITSDEDDKLPIEGNQSEDLVEGLKERGIHLIPIGNKNESSEPSTAEPNVKSTDETVKEKKIEVKSVIILKQSDNIENEQTVIQVETAENVSIEPQQKENEEEETFCETEEEKTFCDAEEVAYSDTDYLVIANMNDDSKEFISIQHDPYFKKYKSLSDYDFTVLKDDVKASIIDDENCVQEICLTVTPYTELLNMPVRRKRKPKSPEEEKELAAKLKTFNILYEEIEDSSSSSSDSFYMKPKDCNVAKKSDPIEKVKSTLEQKSTKKVLSLEDYKNKNRNTIVKPSTSKLTENKIKEITIITDDESDSRFTDKDEDMLMTLALTGTDTLQDNTTKKRKMESDLSQQNAEKKLKKNPQNELFGMDLDIFLNRVHGPSEQLPKS